MPNRRSWLVSLSFLFLLGLPSLRSATLSGSVSDLTGQAVTNYTIVRFILQNCTTTIPRVAGSTSFAKMQVDFRPAANGQLSGTIVGNDAIICEAQGNTYYKITVLNGTQSLWSGNYFVSGVNFNLNSATPLNTNPVTGGVIPYLPGDLMISSSLNQRGVLHGNAGTQRQFLGMSGDGTTPNTWGWFGLTPNDIPSGVNPTLLGNGDVNAAHLSYLKNVTSDVQTQLNSLNSLANSVTNYEAPFGSSTTISVPAATHNQGVNVLVKVYDASGNELSPAVNTDSSGNVTIYFASATAGKYVITGTSVGGGANQSFPFTNLTALTVTPAQHHFTTGNLDVSVYDASGNQMDSFIAVDSSNNVNVSFASAISGRIVITGK
jgi:hypothetical protein